MKTIGIIANLNKNGAAKAVAEVSDWLKERGVTPLITEDCASAINSDVCAALSFVYRIFRESQDCRYWL